MKTLTLAERFEAAFSALTGVKATLASTSENLHAKLANASQAVRDGDVAMSESYLRMAKGLIRRCADVSSDEANALVTLAITYRKVASGTYDLPYQGRYSYRAE